MGPDYDNLTLTI